MTCLYQICTWYIPGIYLAYDHLCHNPWIYIEKTLWFCSVPVTYPTRRVILQEYSWDITCLEGYVTGTEQTHKVFSMYIPGLRHRWSYTMYIPGIYQVYTWYRHVMYEAVIMLIAFLSFLPAGFRGQHFAHWTALAQIQTTMKTTSSPRRRRKTQGSATPSISDSAVITK